MFCPAALFFMLSPAFAVEHSIDRRLLPKNFDDWDRIGLFRLHDGKEDLHLLLYFQDTDSIAEKESRKGKPGIIMYPNFFDVYAVYKGASGKWVHRNLFGYARVRFIKVEKVAPDHLVLQFRPNFMIDISRDKRRPEDVNRPFTKTIVFDGGILSVK